MFINDKNFKVFQRRGDALHLGASISFGIITFNAIILATIAILAQDYYLVAIPLVIRLIVASSLLALINLICIRTIATVKIQTLIDKIDDEKGKDTSNENGNKHQNERWDGFLKGFIKFALSPYWKEVVSVFLSAVALGMLVIKIKPN